MKFCSKKIMRHSLFLSLLLLFSISVSAQPIINNPDRVIEIIKNKKDYPNYSLVTAHRGYWNDVPENSTGAFHKAIILGADLIEIDVRLTSDNKMVAFHDPCLDRITTASGPINKHRWEDIKDLRLKDVSGKLTNYKIQSLEEAVKHLGDSIVISLDVKVIDEEYKYVFAEAVALFRKYKILKRMNIKGVMDYEKLEVLLGENNTSLNEFIYTPNIHNTPKLYEQFTDFLPLEHIYTIQLGYKRTSSPILKDYKPGSNYVQTATARGIWVGSYSFWPGNHAAIVHQDIVTCELEDRDYNFINGITPKNVVLPDPDIPGLGAFDKYKADDGRGDWDWFIPQGTDFITTDRPALLMEYLKTIGKRQL